MYLYGLHSKKGKKLFKKTKDKRQTRVPPFYGLIILFNGISIYVIGIYMYCIPKKEKNCSKDKRQKAPQGNKCWSLEVNTSRQ